MLSRTLPNLKGIDEKDLYKTDEEIFDKAKNKDVKLTMVTRLIGMTMTLSTQPCNIKLVTFMTLAQMAKAEESDGFE